MTTEYTQLPIATVDDYVAFDKNNLVGAYTNPLIDENGQPIDYNGSAGSFGFGAAGGLAAGGGLLGLALAGTPIGWAFAGVGGVLGALGIGAMNPNSWGTGISKKDRAELLMAFQEASAQIDSALITQQGQAYQAKVKAEAAITAAQESARAQIANANAQEETARYDYLARLEETENEMTAALAMAEAEQTRAQAEIDKAEAQQTFAQAAIIDANANMEEAEGEAAKDKAEASSNNSDAHVTFV